MAGPVGVLLPFARVKWLDPTLVAARIGRRCDDGAAAKQGPLEAAARAPQGRPGWAAGMAARLDHCRRLSEAEPLQPRRPPRLPFVRLVDRRLPRAAPGLTVDPGGGQRGLG